MTNQKTNFLNLQALLEAKKNGGISTSNLAEAKANVMSFDD